jgi:hypothetical protein
MASMKRPQLKRVKALDYHHLELTFVDGTRYRVSLGDDVKRLPGLRPLRNANAFAACKLADAGWSIEWPAHDIQIGADTLWLDAVAQNSHDPAQRALLQWRSRYGLSLAAASEALGLTPRTISAYGTGSRAVPKTVLLAIKGWESEQRAA